MISSDITSLQPKQSEEAAPSEEVKESEKEQGKEEWLQKIQDIEELYNIKIYYGILTHFDFGDVLSLLYVSNDPNDWQIERNDLTDGVPFVYALNLTDEWMSEFGGIQIESNNGGLSRVY